LKDIVAEWNMLKELEEVGHHMSLHPVS